MTDPINLAALRAQAEEASHRGEAVLLEPATVLELVERCARAEAERNAAARTRLLEAAAWCTDRGRQHGAIYDAPSVAARDPRPGAREEESFIIATELRRLAELP